MSTQREIKFRAWYRKLQMWASNGWHLENTGRLMLHSGPADVSDTDYVVMQYTGLKDKNGREIYEGDILRARGKVAKVEQTIGGAWTYYFKSTKEPDTWIGYRLVREELEDPVDRRGRIRDVEIMGNIHENPDLLP